MKKLWFAVFVLVCCFAQGQGFNNRNNNQNNNRRRLFNYDYVERKPIFLSGSDSLRSNYLSNFPGFDSLATRAIDNADTGKYIRVHFEFILDEQGIPYEPKFLYIGSTRYTRSNGDKKLKYFDDIKLYFQNAVTKMIHKMPNWKPALQNNQPVHCIVKDYFQFWLGMGSEPQ